VVGLLAKGRGSFGSGGLAANKAAKSTMVARGGQRAWKWSWRVQLAGGAHEGESPQRTLSSSGRLLKMSVDTAGHCWGGAHWCFRDGAAVARGRGKSRSDQACEAPLFFYGCKRQGSRMLGMQQSRGRCMGWVGMSVQSPGHETLGRQTNESPTNGRPTLASTRQAA